MRRELGMFVAFLCMCAGLWFSNPDFLGSSNAINTTRQISMLGHLLARHRRSSSSPVVSISRLAPSSA